MNATALKYAVLGHPVAHSLSPEIQNSFFELTGYNGVYYAFDVQPDELGEIIPFLKKYFCGFNLTIPFKEKIIPYLDYIDDAAKVSGSVNTVKVKDGKLYGYSTDGAGLSGAFAKEGILLKEKSVLLVGSGGVARAALFEALRNSCSVCIAARNKQAATKLAEDAKTFFGKEVFVCGLDEITGHFDIMINCTPVGMHPNVDGIPVTEADIEKCGVIFDTVYSPRNTGLLQTAKKLGKKTIGGINMLVLQGIASQEIWRGETFSDADKDKIIKMLSPENIILTGFMGSGKTTVGKILAEKLGMEFVDVDKVIEEKENKAISDIFAEAGQEYFRSVETEVLKEICGKKGQVISTGGGAVLKSINVSVMKQSGKIVFLDVPSDEIKRRLADDTTRPVLQQNSFDSVYSERIDIYKATADKIFGGTDSGKLANEIYDFLNNIKRGE
ncbi:MAG: shikimate dehydrogenase [Clostridia bacterium]|nr:shikimate dehydrogenase [Clostridia bacterium]